MTSKLCEKGCFETVVYTVDNIVESGIGAVGDGWRVSWGGVCCAEKKMIFILGFRWMHLSLKVRLRDDDRIRLRDYDKARPHSKTL